MNLAQLIASFRHALRGIAYAFREEQNFRIILIAAVVVLGMSFYFPLTNGETVLIILLVMLVLTLELLNTAFERFADVLKPRLHHYIGAIKDLMAGAVLVTSLGAFILGLMIFWPHFMALLK